MVLLELVNQLRRRLDDQGGDTGSPPLGFSYFWESDDANCLWSNAELVGYLNEAVNEYCRRVGRLDNESFSLVVRPGVALYELDPTVLSIQRIVNSSGEPLAKISHEAVDWSAGGFPLLDRSPYPAAAFYYEDIDQSSLRLFGIPVAKDTLTLTGQRLPLEPLAWSNRKNDTPDIPEHHQTGLLYWAAALAYLKRDADTDSPALSQQNIALFAAMVGDPLSAQQERTNRMLANRRPRTRAQFF